MAKQRLKQFDPSKTGLGPSKVGFDGEEDGWVLVKKQRVIIVLPSLPPAEPFTLDNPETSQSQAVLRDVITDTPETTPVHDAVPSLPLHEDFILEKPETSQSQPELRDVIIADMHETTPAHTMVPSFPVPEPFILQKPATSQSHSELRGGIEDMQESTAVHTMVPSLPVPEHFVLQKPATSQSQAELRADMHQTTLVHTEPTFLPVTEHFVLQKPATSQSQAELRADMHQTTIVHTEATFLPVTEHCTLQKPASPQSQAEQRDFVVHAHETTHFHSVEPETCPDFTSVDKPEIIKSPNLTMRTAPAPRRSLQNCRKNPNKRLEIHRSRTSHKPVRFRRVLCSSIVMDNEKLRLVNLEKKVEKAGGLNKWVGSIGLGREFERLLRGQRMSKFQLANLTMEKLKHMGALAVGPRRKLIHAIHCVYHPHCLRSSFN